MSSNYYLLDDMEKYQNDFNRKAYEHLSEQDLIPIFREYYNEHLPVDVTTWIRVNEPNKDLIYKNGQGKQVVFIRDRIMRNMFYEGEYDSERYEKFQPMVVDTHMSKSVLLPVMELNLNVLGIKILLRNNFYNWNLSIESKVNIEGNFMGLINDERYDYCFCEGFPSGKKYGKYQDNHKQFTICIDNDYDLYTFMFLLKNHMSIKHS